MAVTGAVLFLIGTINSFTNANPLEPTEIIVEKHINPALDKLPSLDLQPGFPPFISHFMQHGTNVFFKPQFMLSPSYIPGQELIMENKEDCKKPMIPAIPFAARPMVMIDEPVKIVETVVADSEPPTIDKVIMIKPSPLTPELSISPMFISPVPEPEVDIPVSNPVDFSETPALPPLPIITVPMETVDVKPELIPSAPELPPLEIPQAPLISEQAVEVPLPTVFEEIKPALIPEAPELPPYSPPPLPVPVILSESVKDCEKLVSVEPPMFVSSQPPVIEEVEPIVVPQTPVLPSPTVSLTDIVIPQPAPESTVVEMKPFEIPAAPVLPELEVSKVPLLVEDIKPAVPITIPNPPELLPMPAPVLPVSVVVPEPIAVHQFDEALLVEPMPALVEEPFVKPIEIPAAPILPPMEPISPAPVAQTSSLSSTIEQDIISNEIPLVEVSNPVLPVAFPEAPLLPTVPEISLPVIIEEISVPNEEATPVVKPLDIPAAPELPPLSFPSVPIPLEEPHIGLYPPAEFTSMIVEEPKQPYLEVSKPPLLMPAPVYFPMMIPHMEMVHKSSSLSQVESIISFPTSCVKDIVINRILPNIVKGGIEVVSSPSPNYPVLSPFQPTLGIRLY